MERVTSPSHDSCAILDQGKTNVSPERRADVFFGWQRNVFPRLHGNRHGKILLSRRESSWNTFIVSCGFHVPREERLWLKVLLKVAESIKVSNNPRRKILIFDKIKQMDETIQVSNMSKENLRRKEEV